MTTKSDKKAEIRQRHLAWVNALIERTGKSASQLAADAGLADNTLTRFLNQAGNQTALSSLTVRLLSEHTGLAGPEHGADVKAGRFAFQEGIPFDHKAAESVPGLSQMVRLALRGRPGAAAWELHTNALEGVGYWPGDIVIVDHDIAASARDPVVAQHLDLRGTADTIFRIYEPPVLTGATLNPEDRPRPLVVDNVAVKVVGVITDMVRLRRAPR